MQLKWKFIYEEEEEEEDKNNIEKKMQNYGVLACLGMYTLFKYTLCGQMEIFLIFIFTVFITRLLLILTASIENYIKLHRDMYNGYAADGNAQCQHATYKLLKRFKICKNVNINIHFC